MGKLSEEAEKIQQERSEYVKNIGVEYRFGCYEEKRPESCQLLGEYMEALQQNFAAAFALFKKNCEENKHPKSCYKYGMYLLAGKECTPSLKKMIEPMKIACAADIPQGCRYLSLVYWNGEKDRPAESELAAKYMQRSCELEDGNACWQLSTWYMGGSEKFKMVSQGQSKLAVRVGKRGGKRGAGVVQEQDRSMMGSIARDMSKSLQYAIRACELNVPQSCANVSRMYRTGDGVDKDLDKAKQFAEKAKEIIDLLKSKDADAGFTG